MKKLYYFLPFFFTFIQGYSQVPFNQNPDWISSDAGNISTGGAFADIDKDGWLDFVVANGNDIQRQRVVVYYNDGSGSFPATPDWQSSDIDYHGHLDVGDVNADGWLDVAVSVYIGPTGFNSPGKVKLYLNNSGTLSANPDWISADQFYTFSCAFGDADGDGDLDLAVAGGESYQNNPEQPRIYYNIGGMLELLPSWKATEAQYSYDVNWADFDDDGDLDVVFNGESYPNRIFENVNNTISLTPTWQSADVGQNANSLFIGDVNNDEFLDLAIADNNQLGGQGRFKIYLNNNGSLNTTPFWTSSYSGYGAGIMLADINNDYYQDLLAGSWGTPSSGLGDPCRIYLNDNGIFNSVPEYTSTTASVIEAIICGDIDKDAIQNIQQNFISDGQKKLFYLQRTPVQELNRVIVDADTLLFNEYCYDLENGWVMLASQPDSGINVIVEASVSWDIDMGITNWDSNKGNYLFYNNTNPVYATHEELLPEGFVLYQNYPNPFNPSTTIRYSIPSVIASGAKQSQLVTLKVYDVLGNEVITLVNEEKSAGEYEVTFNSHSGEVRNLTSGIYFYQLKAGDPSTGSGKSFIQTKKMIILK